MQWERLKRAGLAPSKRASFGMVTHRDRALLFGGVTDRAGAGAISSVILCSSMLSVQM